VFNYYLGLALRSLKRNIVLTALMIAAVGVGIGASMTTLTVFRAMDNDPIPQKSRQLFAVQIDNWGPSNKSVVVGDAEHFQEQLSYVDAVGLMNAKTAYRQTAMYKTGAALTPANPNVLPFQVQMRATYTDFFSMFQTPFLAGGPWNADDDKNHADVVVITQKLNDKVFGGGNSVGKSINLDNHEFRVVGVLRLWEPTPQFYDLNNDQFGEGAEIYLPFTRAIGGQMPSWGNNNCNGDVGEPGWQGHLSSECVWIQFWAELPTAADVAAYRAFLNNYASDQQRSGRFQWPAHTKIRNEREWLV
jgi:putative ABC transport system permease protein